MPASAKIMIESLEMVVYFKITEVPIIKDAIDKVSSNFSGLLETYGMLPFVCLAFLILISILLLFKKVEKKESVQKAYDKVLNALMWNSVLRSLIQSYILISFSNFKALPDISFATPAKAVGTIVEILKFVLIFGLPIGSIVFLKKNKNLLKERE